MPFARLLWLNARRIFKVLWRSSHWLFVLYIIAAVFVSIFPVAISYAYKLLLDQISVAHTLGSVITVAVLSAFALRYVFSIIADISNEYMSSYLEAILRDKFENQLIFDYTTAMARMDIPHLENHETQSLITKANQAYPWRLVNFFMYSVYAGVALLTFVFSFIALIPFGVWVPFAMMVAIVPRVLFEKKYVELSWGKFNESIRERKELGYIRNILENSNNLREIKIAQAGPELLGRIKKLLDFFFRLANDPRRKYWPRFMLGIAIEMIVLAGLAYLQVPAAVAGAITIGSLTFYVSMLDRMSSSVERFAIQSSRLFEQNLYVGYYFDVLELKPVIKERDPGVVFDEIRPPEIRFQNVRFSYDPGTEIIKGVNFALHPGEHLAIVGPNGAGKTTLINLLLRFYDPTRGEIVVNDCDLRDLRLSNWYKFISVLFQNFVCFNLTVRDNILLGDPSHIDEQRMREAAQKSGAAEFIEKFPKQYDQPLGRRFEDSVELSRGQWQRLALARAFYESAPILILDEPTSAIDAEAEAEIFDNLYKVYRDKSLIVVSHRFSTVRNADRIIVLKEGAIAEEGNHTELMALNGTYASMFRKQARGYLD